MNLNFQSQNTFINTLFPADRPVNIRFNGPQEAVSDIEFLVGKQCFGLDAGASDLGAILLALNSSRDKHYLLPVAFDEILSNYESALFSDVARRNGLSLIHNRSGIIGKAVPPLRHIPYLLDSFYSSPTQPRYRLGVATLCNYENERSGLVAAVTVEYYTGDAADEDEFHTIWIVTDNGRNIHGGVDTWLALVSADGSDLHTLLRNRYGHGGSSQKNRNFGDSPNQSSTAQGQRPNDHDLLLPYTTDLSYENNSQWPDLSAGLERRHNDDAIAAPERIPGAPPFETSLPIQELSDCTMEELLVYYPEHVLHWPGLAILYNHYRFRLLNSAFEDATQFIKNARGNHLDIPRQTFRRATKRAGSQILQDYETSNFDGHMQPLSEAVQASGQPLGAFLESIIWVPPNDVTLQPPVLLSTVGASVFNHPPGNFAARVLAALQNRTSPNPPNHSTAQSHPIISRCLHGSPEVDETMRDTISLNYYPIHLPEDFVIQRYYTHLAYEPLLYVITKYSTGAIARMVPEEACPDQTHAGFRTFSAKLRKRQQMALLQRGERRRVLFKGMKKETYNTVYDNIKKEYQEERVSGGYGGIRVSDGSSVKRKVSEEEGTDETHRLEPNKKRRRTRKAKYGGRQTTNMPMTYTTPNQPIYSGSHQSTSLPRSMMPASMKRHSQMPWAVSISEQEMGFDTPITSQSDVSGTQLPTEYLDAGLGSVYGQSFSQNYNSPFVDGEQQFDFGRLTRASFDFDQGNGPGYPWSIDPFEQDQYAIPQELVSNEQIDGGPISMPNHHDSDPQSFPPILGGVTETDNDLYGDTTASPQLIAEDWDSLINFQDDSLFDTGSDEIDYRPTSINLTSTLLDAHESAGSDTPVPSFHPDIPSQHHGSRSTTSLPQTPSMTSSHKDKQSSNFPPTSLDPTTSFLPSTHTDAPPSPPTFPPPEPPTAEFEFPQTYSDPPFEDTGAFFTLDQLIDTDNPLSDAFLGNTGIEVIDDFFTDNTIQGVNVDPLEKGELDSGNPTTRDSDRTGAGPEKHAVHEEELGVGVGEWIQGVGGLSSGSVLAGSGIEDVNVDNVGEAEKTSRRGSSDSTDSMASLFGAP
ncbi:hypothetical protein FKW77_008477 [Venturia effusa]|uniref:Uncharacterized protein n=1 Tax=Venturia effusa TaxID=50376 RepID=A0A517L9R4_9PEZI|nr:hypothetical protein FKW77_008477 [Venturia effusa]